MVNDMGDIPAQNLGGEPYLMSPSLCNT